MLCNYVAEHEVVVCVLDVRHFPAVYVWYD